MSKMFKLTFSLLVALTLVGCSSTKQGSASFDLAGDRSQVNAKAQLPDSGKVVFYLKDSDHAKKYKRLDFNY